MRLTRRLFLRLFLGNVETKSRARFKYTFPCHHRIAAASYLPVAQFVLAQPSGSVTVQRLLGPEMPGTALGRLWCSRPLNWCNLEALTRGPHCNR